MTITLFSHSRMFPGLFAASRTHERRETLEEARAQVLATYPSARPDEKQSTPGIQRYVADRELVAEIWARQDGHYDVVVKEAL